MKVVPVSVMVIFEMEVGQVEVVMIMMRWW